jgi:hypothetical protein
MLNNPKVIRPGLFSRLLATTVIAVARRGLIGRRLALLVSSTGVIASLGPRGESSTVRLLAPPFPKRARFPYLQW